MTLRLPAAALLLAALVGPRPAGAQTDYRSLDHDAYALERYGFELALPYELERASGVTAHRVAPELAYGIARNTQLAIEWPIAAQDGPGPTDWGIAGPRAELLYNLNTEGVAVPALGLRATLVAPIGGLGPDQPVLAVAGLATRSWGRARAHLNVAAALGPSGDVERADLSRWSVSAAGDWTVLRRSILLLGELRVESVGEGETLELSAGGRVQLTPTVVLDAGAAAGVVGDAAADLALTLGLSHSFGWRRLLPRGVR